MIDSRRFWRPVSAAIALLLALGCIRSAAAQDAETTEDSNYARYMTGAFPNPHSRLCALIDGNTGKILFARNPHLRRPPASTTKMVACLVLLENGKLTDIVTAPPGIEHTEESSLHLATGEQISLEDLLYAMMLRSANDTPIAGAYYLCGSVPRFVDLMNAEVKKIGCKDTHFVTPNGLYAPGHYSSPYDLALIARYAFAHSPEFAKIVKTPRRQIVRSIHKTDDVVKSTATTFLKVFPGADGVKTGYVHQAGHCFVGSASRGGWRLIAVAMNSPECRSDVMQMLAYGFTNFEPILVYKKGAPAGAVQVDGVAGSVPVVTAANLYNVEARKTANAPAPDYTMKATGAAARPAADVRVGDVVGKVTLLADGKPVMTTDAIASQPAAEALGARVTKSLGIGSGHKAGIIVGKVLGALVMLMAFSLLVVYTYARTLTKINRRRRSRIASNV